MNLLLTDCSLKNLVGAIGFIFIIMPIGIPPICNSDLKCGMINVDESSFRLLKSKPISTAGSINTVFFIGINFKKTNFLVLTF